VSQPRQTASTPQRSFLEPGNLGPVRTRNRLIRAGTGESTAGEDGFVTEAMVEIHTALARGGVGLAFTGHLYCHPRGRYGKLQTGISSDAHLAGLHRLTTAVHAAGGLIFAQIAHAGSQSMVPQNQPLAPSAVSNVMTGRHVAAASSDEVEEAIAAFGDAAGRAAEAGFDGVHIHGANGYLISEFRSPLTNCRTDRWGGSQEARDGFPLAVVRAARAAVPREMALTMKVGFADLVSEPGGLTLDAAVTGAARFVEAGLDGIEVSSNLMSDYVSASIRAYVAVGRRRAFEDLLIHRLLKPGEPEAYFRDFARRLRTQVETTVILVGGIRRQSTMCDILDRGDADFLSLARPFIREPDLVRRLEADPEAVPACVSCNICLMHDEHHPLRCWRTPRYRLVEHALYRLRGGFDDGSGRHPRAEP
jgi:2,4-dienoyl-CoA reductase-like NADH-dependent reductase (Old Yellow Enzyme family)